MAAITLANEMYKEAANKESFIDRLAKYFNENAELIICGLAAMSGQNSYPILKSLSK